MHLRLPMPGLPFPAEDVRNALTQEELRKDLVEEMADVLMYYNDVMLCYGITADELKQAYTGKFEKNMKRW